MEPPRILGDRMSAQLGGSLARRAKEAVAAIGEDLERAWAARLAVRDVAIRRDDPWVALFLAYADSERPEPRHESTVLQILALTARATAGPLRAPGLHAG